LTLGDGTETSVALRQPTLHNTPKERRPELGGGRSIKSRILLEFCGQ